jgi:hypothetical protein
MDDAHTAFVSALRNRDYERLLIRRVKSDCYLVVVQAQGTHVYVDRFGRQVARRHAWEIREWLQREFGIAPDDVAVERVG